MKLSSSIVIIGGGFAGTTLARELQHRLPTRLRFTLISDESYITFNPMLPEAVGASIFPEHAVAPIRAMIRPGSNSRFKERDSRIAVAKLTAISNAGIA